MSQTETDGRRTVQREAVRSALADAGGFVSAQDLHRQVNESGTPVGLATVYRRLHSLVDAGEADALPVPGGQLFRACAPGGHHHHLVCENCGKAIEIQPPDETWFHTSARTHGFTVDRHVLEVFGRCGDCSPN